jgi:predicted transcriptional regulator
MTSVDLTSNQKLVLTALTNLYRQTESPVSGEEIADKIDRNSGTVRNQMQSLKSLQLVEGVPGPKGGYKPTPEAYEALDVDQMDEPANVPLRHIGEAVENVNIEAINLSSVHHPDRCRAKVRIQGSIHVFEEGDEISVGPTPLSDLRITGTIDSKDKTSSILILEVDGMFAPVEESGQ